MSLQLPKSSLFFVFFLAQNLKYDGRYLVCADIHWILPSVAGDDEDDREEEEEEAEHYQGDHENEVDVNVGSLPLLYISTGDGLDHVAVSGVLREERRAGLLQSEAATNKVLGGVRVQRDLPLLQVDAGHVVPGLNGVLGAHQVIAACAAGRGRELE